MQFFVHLFTPEVEKCLKNNETLLTLAIKNYNYDVVKLLIERNNSSLICFDSNNNTILYNLCSSWNMNKSISLIHKLLDNKPEIISLQNIHGNTFLHVALLFNKLNIFKIALNHDNITKEVLNLQNKDKHTCLFYLVRCSPNEILPLLQKSIEKGANIFLKDKKGYTILDELKECRNTNNQIIIDYLMPFFNAKDKEQTEDDKKDTQNKEQTKENNQDFKMYDHVQLIDGSGYTGVIISDVFDDYVTVAYNQLQVCKNILKCKLKKISKPLKLKPGSFIYEFDSLYIGQLVTDINKNDFIVTTKDKSYIIIKQLQSSGKQHIYKHIFPQDVLIWICDK